MVPVESVLNAIAYAKHDIALKCAKALKASKLTLQPTKLMGTGLSHALFRAIHGISGEEVENLAQKMEHDGPVMRSATPTFSMSDIFMGAFGPVPHPQSHTTASQSAPGNAQSHTAANTHSNVQSAAASSQGCAAASSQSYTTASPQSHTAASPQGRAAANPQSRATANSNPLYAKVVSGEASADMTASLALSEGFSLPLQRTLLPEQFVHEFMAIQQVNVILDPKAYPETKSFPDEITDYLRLSLVGLIQRARNLGHKELDVVSKTNLEEIYPTSVTRRRNLPFISPRVVLAKSIEKVSNFIKQAEIEVNLAKPPKIHSNKEMLTLLNHIYNYDVALCAALLGAFMERRIHIPVLKSPEVAAKAVSSPIAVGVWALFSVSRDSLQKMLESSNNPALVIKVKEYIHSVLTDQSKEDDEMEEKMYAGKLQFLLHGMHKTVTSSTKYVSYSLEYQLCKNLKFRKDISVHDLILKWDRIFKDDVLYHVAESHRPLLARWLKWTVLVHELRELLAEYTCIGVTGLINSGKSLLVKRLFNLKVLDIKNIVI